MIVDLFAGPGGWDQGMKDIGITDVLGIEWDKSAVDTAMAAGHKRRHEDVSLINPAEFTGATGLVASPPCQGFSLAGKQLGRVDALAILNNLDVNKSELLDPRSHLVTEPLRYVLAIRPQWAAFEQVGMVLPLWEKMADRLRSEGYYVWTGMLHAEEYGVPQTRKRAYLIAHRDKPVLPPAPTHSKYNAWHPEKLTGPQWITMAQALGWDETDMIGFPRKADKQDKGNGEYRERDLRSAALPSNTVTSKARSWQRWIKENEGKFVGEPSLWPFTRPSPTIVGSFRPDIVAAPGYRKAGDGPRQNASGSVRIEINEAAVLQSFPADYPWQGSRTAQFRQVGDAVPPRVAGAVVRSLLG